MQDLYADRVSQSHDEFEPCVHSDVYAVNRDSPVEYEHHHMQAVLHQSDGARRDVDRLKHRCTCGARRTERRNKLKNKGEDFSRFRNTLRGRGGAAKGGVLDFSPDSVRPGGHSEEKDPNQSSFDQEHSRRIDSSD